MCGAVVVRTTGECIAKGCGTTVANVNGERSITVRCVSSDAQSCFEPPHLRKRALDGVYSRRSKHDHCAHG